MAEPFDPDKLIREAEAETTEEAKKGLKGGISVSAAPSIPVGPEPISAIPVPVSSEPTSDGLDVSGLVKGRKRAGQLSDLEVDTFMNGIAAGESFTLKSDKGVVHHYFRDADGFYLETERGNDKKRERTQEVVGRLRNPKKWKFERVVPIVPEPIVPTPIPDPAALPIVSTPISAPAMAPAEPASTASIPSNIPAWVSAKPTAFAASPFDAKLVATMEKGETGAAKGKEFKEKEIARGMNTSEDKADAGRSAGKKEGLDESIAKMTVELDILRTAYAKKDYEETGVWRRLSRIFGKKLEPTGAVDEKMKYQEKLQELLDARLTLAKLGKEGDDLKEAMAGELQYFNIESKVKLYDAWTETKGEGRLERLGKSYNDLVRKHPWVSAGIGLSLLGAGLASGGAVPVTLTAAVFLKRALATPGLFVTADSMLGKASAWARDRGIKKQIEKEKKKSPEEMEAFIRKMNENPDRALMKCKVGGRVQTSVAWLAATLLLSSAAVNAYEHVMNSGVISVAQQDVPNPVKDIAHPPAVNPVEANGNVPAPPVADAQAPSASLVADAPVASAPVEAPSVAEAPAAAAEAPAVAGAEAPAPLPDVSDAIAQEKSIEEFVNQDITVEKGDSVWKISGRLADQLNLEGAERTHFIDSLKDQFGDVELQEGQVINMGEKGIDRDFIENALGKSDSLIPTQVESINANDAKIAAYALENPDVTLTEEVIDKDILHPQHEGGTHATDMHARVLDSRLDDGFRRVAAFDASNDSPAAASVVEAASSVTSTAERLTEIQLGRSNDWAKQVFGMAPNDELVSSAKTYKEVQSIKIIDVQKDIRELLTGKIYADGQIGENTKLTGWQMKNFADFSNGKDVNLKLSTYVNRLSFDERPKANLGGYMKYLAENAGKSARLGSSGLFTTSVN